MMDPIFFYAVGLVAVIFLVLLNGFFVAVEFAIVRSHVTKFKEPELSGKFGTRSALKLIEELDLSLSATQLGITVASLVLGWLGEAILADFFMDLFSHLSDPLKAFVSHGLATTLALLTVTFLHVVIGELAAKSLAIRYPEQTLRFLAPFMLVLSQLFQPVIFFLNESANLFLRLFGLRAVAESERVHTSGELSMLVAASTKYGALDKEEEQMLQGVFHFSETIAREIMTPRTDVVSIPLEASFDEMYQIVVSSGLSRFPVIGENIDDVKGVLLARDVLRVAPRFMGDKSQKFNLTVLLREAYFIPGTKTIDDLLTELKRRKVHLAIVLDEHGGFDGVVTLEDIIEEIVGEIFDESDGAKLDIIYEENGDVLLDGGVLVDEINEAFDARIAEGDYDTIAGFIFNCIGRIAQENDIIAINSLGQVSLNGTDFDYPRGSQPEPEWQRDAESEESHAAVAQFIVEKVSGNRIETVRYHLIKSEEETTEVLEEAETNSSDQDLEELSGNGSTNLKTA